MIGAVLVAGGVGAWLRAEIAWAVERSGRPARLATTIVNLTGAALLGAIVATQALPEGTRTVLGVGFLGGFTTYSTWMVQESGDGPVAALRRTTAMLLVGLGAATLGRLVAPLFA